MFTIRFPTISILLASLALFAPLSTDAGQELESEPTTYSDYVALTLAHNPSLLAAEKQYQAALRRVPQARTLPNPRLQFMEFGESVQTRTGPQERTLSLSQAFPWFGTLKRRGNRAAAAAEAANFHYQAQALRAIRTVAEAFYNYGYLGKATRLIEENLTLLKELEPVVEQRVKTGESLNALLRLKVEIGRLNDQLHSMRSERQAMSAKLHALTGVAGKTTLPWPEWQRPLGPTTNSSSPAGEIGANPELKSLESTIAGARFDEELARLRSYPDFAIGANYIEIGDAINPSTPDSGRDAWGVTLSMNIPIWFAANKAAREEATLKRQSIQQRHVGKHNELVADLTTSHARQEDAHRRVRLYGDELLDLAKQAVENSQQGYEAGSTTLLELIDSERSLLDMQLLYWRAAADAWQHEIAIRTLTNQARADLTK